MSLQCAEYFYPDKVKEDASLLTNIQGRGLIDFPRSQQERILRGACEVLALQDRQRFGVGALRIRVLRCYLIQQTNVTVDVDKLDTGITQKLLEAFSGIPIASTGRGVVLWLPLDPT